MNFFFNFNIIPNVLLNLKYYEKKMTSVVEVLKHHHNGYGFISAPTGHIPWEGEGKIVFYE